MSLSEIPEEVMRKTRIDLSLFLAVTVFIPALFSGMPSDKTPALTAGFFVVLFIAMGTYALNDHIDSPERRPLTQACPGLLLYLISGFALPFLPASAILLVILNLIICLAYNLWLKHIILMKDLVIGYVFMGPVIFGAILLEMPPMPVTVYFAAVSGILGTGFGIISDIRDIGEDEEAGVITIPVRCSEKTAAGYSALIFVLVILLDPLPFLIDIDARLFHNPVFLAIILIPVFIFGLISYRLHSGISGESIQSLITLSIPEMIAACAAYVAGVLI